MICELSSGPKSPSSVRRTMKEIEEELFELRRENFDLKMRIYIMEEQQDKLFAEKDPQELKKANTLLKSQLSVLKKDLAEKEDLILEAAKAMEQISEQHSEKITELLTKNAKEQAQFKAMIVQLEEDLKIAQEKLNERTYSKFDDSSAMYAMAFGLPSKMDSCQQKQQVVNVEMEVAKLQKALEEEIDKRVDSDAAVSNARAELASLQEVHNNLQEELAIHMGKLCDAKGELEDKDLQIKELENKLSSLEIALREKESETWAIRENCFTSELKKRLSEQEKHQFIKLQSKLDATKTENLHLQEQILILSKKLDELESQNLTKDIKIKAECVKSNEKGERQEQEKRVTQNITLRTSGRNGSDSEKQVATNKLAEKCLECSRLKLEYAQALKTIQEFMVHNKALTKDVCAFKRKIKELSNEKENDKVGDTRNDLAFSTNNEWWWKTLTKAVLNKNLASANLYRKNHISKKKVSKFTALRASHTNIFAKHY